ncbi:MFS transporter [Streptomyces sp. H27-H1]|uniref:MFS transporter n=1 Tax=Streptomyces sp. H27-H1 TaxID=2996461 RepID=UPI00226FC71E|nr:MFS transporter [Streptomyces sp. H27-H1]MCY0928631.1 MFS transporter [Streptomyces sp. H27-H1]
MTSMRPILPTTSVPTAEPAPAPVPKPAHGPTPAPGPARLRTAAFSAGHSCVDVYQGSVAALVPFLVAERSYGYAAASGIVLAASLLSSVVQPLFGALTDRWPMPWLIPLATAAAGLGVALVGLDAGYAATLAAVALSGLGVAAYHPAAARMVRTVGGPGHGAMSWFALGGNIGFACAPLLVVGALSLPGSAGWWALAAPAALGVFLNRPPSAKRSASERAAENRAAAAPAPPRPPSDDWRAFLRLSLVVVVRSVVFMGLSTFIALYVRERGGGETAGAAALFALFAGSAGGTLLGARLAARWGRVTTVHRSYAAAVPAVAGILFLPLPLVYACATLAAAALYVPLSLQVTLGQDYLPTRMGTASGVTLGLTVSVGGLASPLIGAAADAASLRTALLPLAALPLLAWALARRLPEPAEPEPTTARG